MSSGDSLRALAKATAAPHDDHMIKPAPLFGSCLSLTLLVAASCNLGKTTATENHSDGPDNAAMEALASGGQTPPMETFALIGASGTWSIYE